MMGIRDTGRGGHRAHRTAVRCCGGAGMRNAEEYEAIASEVCELDRAELLERLTHFDGALPLDFSAEYLEQCATDQMRHILVAALWRCRVRELSS